MNQPFTPPETVPARRIHLDAWDRPIRGSFLAQDDAGRTILYAGDDVRRFGRGLFCGLAASAAMLLVVVAVIAGLRAGGVL